MSTKAQIRAAIKQNKENTTTLCLRMHLRKDADIIQKLNNVDNKNKFIKGLIRDEIYKEREQAFTMDELEQWNKGQEREDTMYYIDLRIFDKRQSGYYEISGDPVVYLSNDYEEILTQYDLCKYYHEKDNCIISIMKAYDIYKKNLEYVAIKQYSTLNDKIKIIG